MNVAVFFNMVHKVLCHGCCDMGISKRLDETKMGKRAKFLTGPHGHIERFPAWVHIVAFLAFAAYAVVRHLTFYDATTAFGLATVADVSSSFTFLSSVIYHVSSDDMDLSFYTRQLDFIAIYVSISLCSVADIAAATRGFLNVPVVSVVDVPLAATILVVFFALRRYVTDSESSTFTEYNDTATACKLGLTRKWHTDKEHAALRQSTSFVMAIFYFTITPAIMEHSDDAVLILTLQVVAIVLLVLGMILDSVVGFPERWIAQDDKTNTLTISCISFPKLGCFIGSHGIWHVLAAVAVAMTTLSREYTLLSI